MKLKSKSDMQSGSSILEVIIAMSILGLLGVTLCGAVLISRPVTDRMVVKSKLNQQVNVYLDNLRTRKFIPCTAQYANIQDNLYPFQGSQQNDRIKTEVFYKNMWIPCTKEFFNNPVVSGVSFSPNDLTQIGLMKIEKVTVTKTNKSGKNLVRIIVKTSG